MALLTSFLPFLGWFKKYTLSDLRVDLISGLTVALVLVPQSMAYAQLAGLPAYYGLYASFLPPMIASLFGSSRQLATGPVAVVSLMTATALEPLATAGSESFIAYAILLALMVGVFQFALGVFRLGLVVNFLSHPVVNGFTNAAAIIIASSQLSKLFGVYVDKAEHHYETIYNVIREAVTYTHLPTLGLAFLAFAIMIILRRINRRIPNVLVAVIATTLISWATGFHKDHDTDISHLVAPRVLERIQMYNNILDDFSAKSEENVLVGTEIQKLKDAGGPGSAELVALEGRRTLLDIEILGLKELTSLSRQEIRSFQFRAAAGETDLRFYPIESFPRNLENDGLVWRLKVENKKMDMNNITLRGGGAVVGHIPEGLPSFKVPTVDFNLLLTLLPMAMIISLLGFMEAISIAKAMASKTGHRLDPNQELIGQGLANMIGAAGQSYAVSGSFSRSAVNLQAGAVTGLSNVFSSAIVVLTLLFFTPLLYFLPQAVLAAIIMMAVFGLINIRGFIHAWNAQWYDGLISVLTFVCTLAFAPHLDRGIMIGVGLSIMLHLLRDMKPSIAMLAKHPDGTYRNRHRFGLASCRHIAVVRYQGSLIFANVNYLEETILEQVASKPELKHIIIVGNGINELDASGEEMLSALVNQLWEAGYDLSFSGLNDQVIDVLRRTDLLDRIGEDHFYRDVTRAIDSIWDEAHKDSDEIQCPIIVPVKEGESNISLPPEY